MDKLEKLPFKVLFYLGFIIVIIFIGLSYWQLTSHYDDRNNLENTSEDYANLLKINRLIEKKFQKNFKEISDKTIFKIKDIKSNKNAKKVK